MLTGDESCGCLTLDGHLDPTCGCYEEGMAQGKKQLEMELEAWSPRTHPPGCDCLPCRLSRSWAEVRSAQGVVDIEQAQRNLGRIVQHLSGPLQHLSESEKQNLRRNLSVLLRMNIINFVKTPGSPHPTYVLSTQQGDITIGPTRSLTSQKKCMDRIFETTGVVVPVVSREVWRQCIQGLKLISEKVPVGNASHSAQDIKVETRTWLHDYITDRGVRDEEESEKVARDWANAPDTGSPFMKKGLIRIFLGDFGKWLEVNRGKNLKSRALGKPRLGRVGAEAGSINVRISETRTTRSVWVLPETFQPPQPDDEDQPGSRGGGEANSVTSITTTVGMIG